MNAPSLLRRIYLALAHGKPFDERNYVVTTDPVDRLHLATLCTALEDGKILSEADVRTLASQRAYHFMSNAQFVRLVESTIIDRIMNADEVLQDPNNLHKEQR